MADPSTRISILRITGISLAFSFLYFMRVYRQLLYPAYDWYFEYDVPRLEILTTLFCSLVVFCLFFGLLLVIRARHDGRVKTILEAIFFTIGVLAFGPVSAELLTWWLTESEFWFKYVLPVIVCLICILVSRSGSSTLSGATTNLRTISILVLPISILTFGHASLLATGILTKGLDPNSSQTTVEVPKSDNRLPRVVWVVFDELDFGVMEDRPSTVRLPAFEQLESDSFVAERAFPPHYWTSVSILALLTGRTISRVSPHGAANISLHLSDGPPVELTETDSIFDDVLTANGNSAVAGWYNPYPRIFPDKLAMAFWTPMGKYRCKSFTKCSFFAFAHSFEDVPLIRDLTMHNPFADSSLAPHLEKRLLLSTNEHVESNRRLREHAKDLVVDKNLDLVFLHFPIPHAPYITRSNESANSYFDSLEAADETLSMLIADLNKSKLWERTTLIVSSDHWLRAKLDSGDGLDRKQIFEHDETRIPFIVRLAGGGNPSRYTKQFNTVVTRYFIRAIMTGEVSTTEDIAAWFDRVAVERPELVDFHPCTSTHKLRSLDREGSSDELVTCQ